MRYTLLLLCVVLFSCSSAKQDYSVINDFLDTELNTIKYDTLFVKIKAIDRIDGLKKYEQAYKERNYGTDKLRQMWINPPLNPWPIDSLEIDSLKQRLSKDEKKLWNKSEFKNKELIIAESTVHNDKEFLRHHLRADNYVLTISQPFYDKKQLYAFFVYYHSPIFGNGSSSTSGLIVMKKTNGKWLQISWIENEVYY